LDITLVFDETQLEFVGGKRAHGQKAAVKCALSSETGRQEGMSWYGKKGAKIAAQYSAIQGLWFA
jgi:hypothetical protein